MVASVLATEGALTSAPVQAAGVEGWAYLFSNQAVPTSNPYTPTRAYQFNSTGGINTVDHDRTGRYIVRLPNLGAAAGSVHVTAVGSPVAGDDASGAGTCNVEKWGPTSGDQYVWVRCFDLAGRAADGTFTVAYTNLTSSPQPMAYLRATERNPSPSTYTPPLAYQFNSTGAKNTVTRTGVGTYTAHLPGLASPSGYVQVTAFGSGSGRCQVTGWGPKGTSQDVNVRCFNADSVRTDTNFTLTYLRSISVVGSPYKPDLSGTSSAHVLGSKPTMASYTPRKEYLFNSAGGTNTVRRAGVGVYQVNFPQQQLERGTVQLSVFGTQPVHCKVASWGPTSGVQVRCFTRTGTPKDQAFQATFLVSTGLAQRVAVPSYFREPQQWAELTGNAPPVGLAIINPNSGPGEEVDSLYAQQLKASHDRGIMVLGYVYTNRGAIPRDKVIADIDKYYELYPGIDGIFLDDVFNTDCSLFDHYKGFYDRVKSKPGRGTVVINPGNHTQECYMTAADIVVNFESYYIAPTGSNDASYAPGQPHSWELRAWERKYPPERFWHLVHGTSQADMAKAIRLSKQRNAGRVYVTDDVMDNPWNVLPTYWDAELDKATAP
jgi:hypothetical protein